MAKADQYYAEMLSMMRKQGKKDNPITLQLGIMQSSNSVKINDLLLEADDLYIAEHLTEGYRREMETSYASSGSYMQGDIVYTDGLKVGDIVIVQQLYNSNLFVILERVVRA